MSDNLHEDSDDLPASVDAPHSDLACTLAAARRTYGEVYTADDHHTAKVLEFIARTAMVIRDARREPDEFRAAIRDAKLKPRKGQREEVTALRVAANDPKLRQPKWASAAAYCAAPPNGDDAPGSYGAALIYLEKRGGMKRLSDLWTAFLKGKEDPPPATEQIDALLEGLEPDFLADAREGRFLADVPGEGYVLGLIKLGNSAKGGSTGYILAARDRKLITIAKAIRTRGVLRDGIAAYVQRTRAAFAEAGDADDEGDDIGAAA